MPVKQYSCRGGFSAEKEIQEYINSFAYSVFSGKIADIHAKVRGYLESGMEPTPWNMAQATVAVRMSSPAMNPGIG